ncbi:UNVERIFIED_CONTAM: hypothetical protein FKN15_073694 [Acipenser sinensis]
MIRLDVEYRKIVPMLLLPFQSDVIIGLGCHDIRVAERSASLFLEGWASWLLFTGYLGNQTAGVWQRPEAEIFTDVAVKMGVPRDRILLETGATNTGENIRFSYQILMEQSIPACRVILVQQPFMERRVYATFLQQWPAENTQAIVTSPALQLQGFPNHQVGSMQDLIGYMLDGDVTGMDDENCAQVLWNYLQMHHPLVQSDVIIGLGCHDIRVAERSASLFLEGWASWLLFTGYLGNQTAGVLERIRDYPQKGFQVEQEISSEALDAYQWFLQAGYRPK